MINPNPILVDREKGNFHYNTEWTERRRSYPSEKVVKYILDKNEEEWVKDFRPKALKTFEKKKNAYALGFERSGKYKL